MAGAALWGASPAAAASSGGTRVARGVVYKAMDIRTGHGVTRAHVLRVDLADPRVQVGLLSPGVVSRRAAVSRLADGQGAVAGVNGDFFDIEESQHPGVEATGAPVGPAIADGRVLKGPVPDSQRFGPALPPGTHTTDVFGVGTDGRPRMGSLRLDGSVRARGKALPLRGLNQYALPQNAVGAYTSRWGSASRVRATCGSDTRRADPCGTDTYEVTVRSGRVVSRRSTPGSGPVPAGTTVLLGREAGARWLRHLSTGTRVSVRYRLVDAGSRKPYRFAVGGYPVLENGTPLPGLNATTAAVRTAVGVSADGRTMLLLATDGAPRYRTGLTIAEVASVMRKLGSVKAFSLDGGGSSTLVARKPGAARVSVLNHPSGGAERPVPNGIGVFTRR